MIFVTVGTSHLPFDRLVCGVEPLTDLDRVVVQAGSSHVWPPSATCFDYLPYEEIEACLDEARVVVTHAGIGSVVLALRRGLRPVVVPRRQRYRESVDDHQVSFAERLAERHLVTLVDDPADLQRTVAQSGEEGFVQLAPESAALALDIRKHLWPVIRGRAATESAKSR